MSCTHFIEILRGDEPLAHDERRSAEAHVAACANCRQALAALAALDGERARPAPAPPPGAAARAVERALRSAHKPVRTSRAFWLGAAAGGGMAAALAVGVAVWLGGGPPVSAPVAIPQVALRAGDSRDVSVALTSNEPLAGVEIHVVLTGAIGLAGYDTRELRWMTDLDRGVNELSLPVVAIGPGGGQLTVEVVHGERRRTFVVDVLGRG